MVPELLNQTKSPDNHIVNGVHIDTEFPSSGGAADAAPSRIVEPGHAEAVQVQRQARSAKGDAGRTCDCADHITDKLTVFRDR